MSHKKRWLALLLLLLVLSLPLVLNLDIFRRQVHEGLARQMGLRVQVESLTGRLLPRPGVVGTRVRVFQPQGFGAEPFLHAQEVRCDLPLSLLWTGTWRCAEVHFDRPSINLVRNEQGEWNLAALLTRPGTSRRVSPPLFTGVGGRLHIKLGYDKLVHSFDDVSLRAAPEEDGRWRLQLEAFPTRNDRRLAPPGTLRLDAHVTPTGTFAELPFRVQLGLEGGSLSRLFTLVTDEDAPLRADFSLQGELDGTPANWDGRLNWTLAHLRHSEVLAPSSSPRWQGQVHLRMADEGQLLYFNKLTLQARDTFVEAHGRLTDPFGQRRWVLEVTEGRIAFNELLQQWAGLEADVPATTRLDGVARLSFKAQGGIKGWQGLLAASETLALRGSGFPEPVEMAGLRLRLAEGRLVLDPLTLRFSPGQAITVEGAWRLEEAGWPYRLHWQAEEVGLRALRRAAGALGWNLGGTTRWQGRARLDLVWQGRVAEFAPPRWLGRAEIREAKIHPPEFNEPLVLPEVTFDWRNDRLRVDPLVVRLDGNAVSGSLARDPDGIWHAQLAAEQLELETLDLLFNPARRGLLTRLVEPEPRARRWDSLRATGEFQIRELAAGPFRFQRFQARARWEEGTLRLGGLRFRAYGGRFRGSLAGNFRVSPPRFELAGNLKQARLGDLLDATTELGALYSGLVGADLTLESAGTRHGQLLRELQGRVVGVVHDGTVSHVDLLAAMKAASPGFEVASAEGTTQLESLAGQFLIADRQVELDGVRMIIDGVALELLGRARFDGGLDIRLTGEPLRVAGRPSSARAARLARHAYRLRGTLHRPLVELVERAPAPASSSR